MHLPGLLGRAGAATADRPHNLDDLHEVSGGAVSFSAPLVVEAPAGSAIQAGNIA
jgi:hypothetical protein